MWSAAFGFALSLPRGREGKIRSYCKLSQIKGLPVKQKRPLVDKRAQRVSRASGLICRVEWPNSAITHNSTVPLAIQSPKSRARSL